MVILIMMCNAPMMNENTSNNNIRVETQEEVDNLELFSTSIRRVGSMGLAHNMLGWPASYESINLNRENRILRVNNSQSQTVDYARRCQVARYRSYLSDFTDDFFYTTTTYAFRPNSSLTLRRIRDELKYRSKCNKKSFKKIKEKVKSSLLNDGDSDIYLSEDTKLALVKKLLFEYKTVSELTDNLLDSQIKSYELEFIEWYIKKTEKEMNSKFVEKAVNKIKSQLLEKDIDIYLSKETQISINKNISDRYSSIEDLIEGLSKDIYDSSEAQFIEQVIEKEQKQLLENVVEKLKEKLPKLSKKAQEVLKRKLPFYNTDDLIESLKSFTYSVKEADYIETYIKKLI